MRRTLAFCEWKSNWWRERRSLRLGAEELLDGVCAYAKKQAYIWSVLAEAFARDWAPLIHQYRLPSDWPVSFCAASPGITAAEGAKGRHFISRVKDALRLASLQDISCDTQIPAEISSCSDSE